MDHVLFTVVALFNDTDHIKCNLVSCTENTLYLCDYCVFKMPILYLNEPLHLYDFLL